MFRVKNLSVDQISEIIEDNSVEFRFDIEAKILGPDQYLYSFVLIPRCNDKIQFVCSEFSSSDFWVLSKRIAVLNASRINIPF